MQNSTLKSLGNEKEAFLNNLAFETNAFKDEWGDDGRMMKIRKDFTDASIQEFNRARLGLITNFQAMGDFTKQSVGAMKSSFTSLFQDAFGGQLKTAREYFMAFLQDIVNAWSRAMAEMAATQILAPKQSKTSQALGIVSSIASIFGGGAPTTGSAITPGTTSTPRIEGAFAQATPRAHGGWVGQNGPELVLAGENEPEMVTPLSKMNNAGGQSTKNVYYFIQAVDPRSFAEIVASNPEAIVAVTERAIESSKRIRRTIRSLA